MEYLYKTILDRGRAELVIEKSKFIATAIPCESREEAESFFSEIRAEFKDATHNVPAFVLGRKMELKWASDDGEPQGTAGPPILKFLEANELTNIAVMVTRYFGGIKLGTGGLVRAYTDSASAGVDASKIALARNFLELTCMMDYSLYNRILSQGIPSDFRGEINLSDPEFGENVRIKIKCPEEKGNVLKGILMDMSNGSIAMCDERNIVLSVSLT